MKNGLLKRKEYWFYLTITTACFTLFFYLIGGHAPGAIVAAGWMTFILVGIGLQIVETSDPDPDFKEQSSIKELFIWPIHIIEVYAKEKKRKNEQDR